VTSVHSHSWNEVPLIVDGCLLGFCKQGVNKHRSADIYSCVVWFAVTQAHWCIHNTVWRETFEEENFHELVNDFCGENFRRLLAFAMSKVPHPQISWRNLSQIATKPQNSRKFSPSKVSRYTVGGSS